MEWANKISLDLLIASLGAGSIVLATLIEIFWIVKNDNLRNTRWGDGIKTYIDPGQLLAVSTLLFMALVPAFYSITNFIAVLFTADSWGNILQAELSSGLLALRLASITLGTSCFLNLLVEEEILSQTISALKIPWIDDYIVSRQTWLLSDHFEDKQELPAYLSAFANNMYLMMNRVQVQYKIFLLGEWTLWFAFFNDAHSISVSFLSWLLFFFFDEWVLMASYLGPMRGNLRTSHYRRLKIATYAILLACIFIAFELFHILLAFAVTGGAIYLYLAWTELQFTSKKSADRLIEYEEEQEHANVQYYVFGCTPTPYGAEYK